MAILIEDSRPATGPDSHGALDDGLLAGFVTPGMQLSHGRRKIVAARLSARMVAVETWISTGERPTHKALAGRLGVSERCLSYQFPTQSGLFAFPPPELAQSLAGASASAVAWTDIAKMLIPVFNALNTNPAGRALLAGLVQLHRDHPDLTEIDNYFDYALRDAIAGKRQRRTLAITGLFTDGLRTILEDWVDNGQPDLNYVAERVQTLLTGPIQAAYEELQK